jgi:hypothetical protein
MRPLEEGGRRERRVFVAPAASRTKVESTRVSHHRYAETVRRSPRDGLRLMPRSPRSAGLDSLRRLPELPPADLIPASGNQDHAVLLVREDSARLAISLRPSHPVPTFVAIGQTPLHVEAGWTDTIIYFRKTEEQYFCEEGWTRRANQCSALADRRPLSLAARERKRRNNPDWFRPTLERFRFRSGSQADKSRARDDDGLGYVWLTLVTLPFKS